jgi:hypothetical protein
MTNWRFRQAGASPYWEVRDCEITCCMILVIARLITYDLKAKLGHNTLLTYRYVAVCWILTRLEDKGRPVCTLQRSLDAIDQTAVSRDMLRQLM